MKIIIASPLYPPDIAFPAPYVKELAIRLSQISFVKNNSGEKNEVIVITYGEIPEKIPGVEILTTSKRRPLLIRLFSFTALLRKSLHGGGILCVENGASVELPVILISLVTRTPIVFHFSDTVAHRYASSHALYRTLENIVRARSKKVIEDMPLSKPEILPFSPKPEQEFLAYEHSWSTHIQMLEEIFSDLTI